MPDKKIFCNTPWYELHVYWDGSLGICCAEDHKIYSDDEIYNIADMSLLEWFNSLPVKRFRWQILGQDRLSACARCYAEEDSGGHSRRIRSNIKSAIFTKQSFTQSYLQSPGHAHFQLSQRTHGLTDTWPVDLHIDLGNYCNLACKMCNAQSSSQIASQQVRWGHEVSRKYLGTDWTRDQSVWQNFLDQLLCIPGLQNIHVMGGETLLTKRFEDLVDWLTAHKRFDVCLSFVTNGTIYPQELMTKLAKFSRVGIEISIETMTDHNQYTRQGTDNRIVLANLQQFKTWTVHDHVSVTLRTAPSLLTVGQYHSLLDYALQNHMVIKSILCQDPYFLRIELLPDDVKQLYKERLDAWALDRNLSARISGDYNASDSSNVSRIVREQFDMVRNLLDKPCPDQSHQHHRALVRHCEQWDRLYGLDARICYPELQQLFDRYNYAV